MQEDMQADPGSHLRILLCDDDPGIREVYRHALSHLGHEVVTAASGRSALQFMMQYRFDVLSVDIQMPEMNGIVFLQEALKIWPWVGVVVVSGFADATAVTELGKLGVERVLHKPVPLEDLLANIVAAAAERPKPDESLSCEPLLTLMKDHLKLLSQTSAASIGTGALSEILNDFIRDLALFLPCDMLAMLVNESENPIFMAHLRHPVGSAFVDTVRDELLTRYRVVSGQDLKPLIIENRIDGMLIEDDGPQSVKTTLSIPVFLDDAVCAMLILAAHAQVEYRPSDVSLLYLAANHVGVFVLTLRRMQYLAMRDGLTGLFNRLRIEEELERAWRVAGRYGTPMAVVVLDMDHFKVMNDTYGHATGDQVLCAFADLMCQAARATDILARFGGDEFIAILPHAGVDEARMFCDRLRQITRDHVFCPSTHRLKLTVSMGLVTSDNSSAPANAAELLSQADRALYKAKRAGRDRICVWTGNVEDAWKSPVEKTSTSMSAKSRAHVLLAGDDEGVQGLLADSLAREGYDIRVATSAAGALTIVKEAPGFYDIMVVDIGMPDMAGIGLLKLVSEADHLLVAMAVAEPTKLEEVVQCLREGAIDLLLKPVEPEILLASMQRAMRYRLLKLENLHHQRHLERMVEQRSVQLHQMLEDIKRNYEFTLEAFTAMLDAREPQTGRHSLRVREMSIWLARRMNVRGSDLDEIAAGALLHDIGKIAVPDRVLLSSDPLPPEEQHIMQAHAGIGTRILAGSQRLAGAARIVGQHHEWYDGSGYPNQLKGEDICLGARIFAVVDAYDAMRSDRTYRLALSEDEAVTEIIKKSGAQFDPMVVEVFLAYRDECAQLFQQLNDDHSMIPTVITE